MSIYDPIGVALGLEPTNDFPYKNYLTVFADCYENSSVGTSGFEGKKHCEETLQKMKKKKGPKKKPQGPMSEEHKVLRRGKGTAPRPDMQGPMTKEERKNRYATRTGRKWYNDGENNIITNDPPIGFILGRIPIFPPNTYELLKVPTG